MRQLFLPTISKKTFVSQGTFTSAGTTGLTLTLPDGIWTNGFAMIAKGTNQGVNVHFGTDKTKTQSFSVGNSGPIGGLNYTNFYSKIQGNTVLSGTEFFNPALADVWIDATVRPNTFNIRFASAVSQAVSYSVKVNR